MRIGSASGRDPTGQDVAAVGDSSAPPGPQAFRYAVFVSYNRKVDGRLAHALRDGLQRFAKPWYRWRALRVFRDDANLSIASALWTPILDALDNSAFFLLLASPEAARSEGVDKEVEHWRRHRGGDRLLIALTDGELVWDDERGDFALERSALPPAIAGLFAEQPRHTDLRWARAVEHLSLSDPQFGRDVADIAATLHGVPKERMVHEEIRQHRRTVRLVTGTIVVLLALLVAVAVAGLYARDQRDEARAQRAVAEDRERVATSRALAAQANANLESRLDRALLLSVAALDMQPTVEARSSLLQALQRAGRLRAFLETDARAAHGLAFSPDGGSLAAGTADGRVTTWDVVRKRPEREPFELRDVRLSGLVYAGAAKLEVATADGRIGILDTRSGAFRRGASPRTKPPPAVVGAAAHAFVSALAVGEDDGLLVAGLLGPGGAVVWDRRNGKAVHRIPARGVPVTSVALSHDEQFLAVGYDDGRITIMDLTLRPAAEAIALRAPRRSVTALAFAPDGATLASASARLDKNAEGSVREEGTILLWSLRGSAHPLGSVVRVEEDDTSMEQQAQGVNGRTRAVVGNDGSVRVTTDSGQTRSLAADPGGRVLALDFSRDGRRLVTGGFTGRVTVWDVRTGRGTSLGDLDGEVTSVAFDRAARMVAVGGIDGSVHLWDLSSRRSLGDGIAAHDQPVTRVRFVGNGNRLRSSDGEVAILWNLDSASWTTLACDIANRELSAPEWERYGGIGERSAPRCSGSD